tara:strand:+ start:81 stop:635 length:555 start_codon:yes stop_codon:yes gene_type:complete
MSTLEVNTISPISGSSDVTLGGSSKNIKFASGTTVDFSTNSPTLSGLPNNTPAFVAYVDANQSLTNGTATKLTFTSESIDTDSAFADSKFTVPSGKAGRYFFHGKFRASSFTGSLNLDIYKNGSNAGIHFRTENQSAGNNFGTCAIFAVLDLVAGDYIEIYGYQFQGGTQNVTSKLFEGYRLTS